MPVQVTTIMIGVQDLARSKKFYAEGLGCAIDKDFPNFVSFSLGEGSSSLALYEWDAAAADAGVRRQLTGFERKRSLPLLVNFPKNAGARPHRPPPEGNCTTQNGQP